MAVHQRIIGTSQAADSCNFRTNRSAVRAEVEHVPGVVSISRSIYNHIHAAPLRTGDLFDGIFQLNINSSAGLNQVKVAGEGGGILAQQAFYLQVNITNSTERLLVESPILPKVAIMVKIWVRMTWAALPHRMPPEIF